MSSFKINSVDLGTCAEVVSTSSKKGKCYFFNCGKINLPSDISSGYTVADAPSGYTWTNDISKGKLKVNGTSYSLSAKGYRPNAIFWASDEPSYTGSSGSSGSKLSGSLSLTKNADGSISCDGTVVIPASYDAHYVYVAVQACGGGGGSGKGGGGDAYGGGGGGSGAACLVRAFVNTTGTFLKITSYGRGDGSSAKSSSGSEPSGADGETAGSTYVYNGSGTLVATLGGGGGGSDGWGASSGGGGGTFTEGTVPTNWKVWGKNGGSGTGGFKHNAPNSADWSTRGEAGSFSMSEDIPSGESTFSFSTLGGYKNGTKDDGGGGGGAGAIIPVFGSGQGGQGGYEAGDVNTTGGGRNGEPGAIYGAGSGGGGGGAASTWTVPGGVGGWGGSGGLAIYY